MRCNAEIPLYIYSYIFEREFNCIYNFPVYGIQDKENSQKLIWTLGVIIFSLPQSIVDWKPLAMVVPFLPQRRVECMQEFIYQEEREFC